MSFKLNYFCICYCEVAASFRVSWQHGKIKKDLKVLQVLLIISVIRD